MRQTPFPGCGAERFLRTWRLARWHLGNAKPQRKQPWEGRGVRWLLPRPAAFRARELCVFPPSVASLCCVLPASPSAGLIPQPGAIFHLSLLGAHLSGPCSSPSLLLPFLGWPSAPRSPLCLTPRLQGPGAPPVLLWWPTSKFWGCPAPCRIGCALPGLHLTHPVCSSPH